VARLFTFGCSFTFWNWPTWADFLATGEFEEFQNWGYPGLGNLAIAERVAEANTFYKFTEEDLVIVQWSSYLRNDYARTDRLNEDGKMWQTRGSVYAPANHNLYDSRWFNNFFDPRAYYIRTLNHIALTQQLLENTKCRWRMMSNYDLQNIHAQGEVTDPDEEVFNVFEDNKLLPYKENIWDNYSSNWLPNLIETKWSNNEYDWVFNSTKENIFSKWTKNGKYVEPHLTPKQQLIYIINLVDNSLIPDSKVDWSKCEELVKQYHKLYSTSNSDWDQFLEEIEKVDWLNGLVVRGQ